MALKWTQIDFEEPFQTECIWNSSLVFSNSDIFKFKCLLMLVSGSKSQCDRLLHLWQWTVELPAWNSSKMCYEAFSLRLFIKDGRSFPVQEEKMNEKCLNPVPLWCVLWIQNEGHETSLNTFLITLWPQSLISALYIQNVDMSYRIDKLQVWHHKEKFGSMYTKCTFGAEVASSIPSQYPVSTRPLVPKHQALEWRGFVRSLDTTHFTVCCTLHDYVCDQ